MELKEFMDIWMNVVMLIMFTTGGIPCIQMVQSGSTKNIPYFIFLINAFTCSCMCHYAILKGETPLALLNGIGGVLHVIYTFLYIFVVKQKKLSLFLLAIACSYYGGVYSYLYLFEAPEDLPNTLGTLVNIPGFIMMFMPYYELYQNLRHQHSDGMPPVMLGPVALAMLSWLTYGILLNDPILYMPHIPGVIVLTGKTYVILKYGPSEDKIKQS